MASGDIAAIVLGPWFPGANTATPDVRAGGSTPAENHEVYDFDGTTDEYLDFLCYALTAVGITITHEFMMSSATSGNIEIETALRRRDTADDIDVSHSYSFQSSGAVSVPGTSGYSKQTTTAHTTGAQMDSVVAGERFILRVKRDNTVASNASGDMEYMGIPVIKET
jgi:hypothetical protein